MTAGTVISEISGYPAIHNITPDGNYALMGNDTYDLFAYNDTEGFKVKHQNIDINSFTFHPDEEQFIITSANYIQVFKLETNG